MNSGELSQRLRDTAALLDGLSPTTDTLKALQGLKNLIETAQATASREMAERLDHEAAGYASPKAFLRAELGLDVSDANQLLDAGATLRDLPEVAGLADEGALSLSHVREFSYALRFAGEQPTREVLPELLDVAQKAAPTELHQVMRQLRDAVYPDDLDAAWIRGMAKEDLRLNAVPDGFHVTGFLNSTVGTKLTTLLQSLTAPAGADDPRPAAQRRVDGLEKLLDSVLGHGLPGDRGVRPHLRVTIDADALDSGEGSGDLLGYGPIGVRQAHELLCDSTITPLVVSRSARERFGTKKVGRAMRLASSTQRIAVENDQHHQCAAPGCSNPVVHVHHVVWWSRGGTTDRENLIGLCPRCHRAVHAGTLVIDPSTHEFRSRSGLHLPATPIPWRRRRRLRPEELTRVHRVIAPITA